MKSSWSNLLFWYLLVGMASPALAQSSWDGSPYDVHVWVSLEAVPELADRWSQRFPQLLEHAVRKTMGATWQLRIRTAPAPLRRDLHERMDELTVDAIGRCDEAALKSDKLYLVSIQRQVGAAASIAACELDCYSRLWGPVLKRTVRQPSRVGAEAARAVVDAFRPLARIEKVEPIEALVRLRAGRLIGPRDTAALLPTGSLLRPMVRHNDSVGQREPDAAQPLPWTVLEVLSERGDMLQCAIHSGVGRPLARRRSRRLEQLALGVRTDHRLTRLRLADRAQPDRPLVGYDVYVRDRESTHLSFIGRSNWQGVVDIPAGPDQLQVLYAKSGQQVLARLPLVTGEQELVTALLDDDGPRLDAEGFLTGLQEQLVDLAARRTIQTTQIQQRIAGGQWDQAEELIDALRELPTRDALVQQLRQRKQSFATDDVRVRRETNRLFDELERRIDKNLDPREIETLREELAHARGTKGT
jgi:hypothetical protein